MAEAELELLRIRSELESNEDCSDLIVSRFTRFEEEGQDFVELSGSKFAFESSIPRISLGIVVDDVVVVDFLGIFFELFLPTPLVTFRLEQSVLCLSNSVKVEKCSPHLWHENMFEFSSSS